MIAVSFLLYLIGPLLLNFGATHGYGHWMFISGAGLAVLLYLPLLVIGLCVDQGHAVFARCLPGQVFCCVAFHLLMLATPDGGPTDPVYGTSSIFCFLAGFILFRQGVSSIQFELKGLDEAFEIDLK
ncbi:hypothetical protein HNP46_004168 [Pseudomonas nitritireducens]|uniref:Uncharacterized protein n=1 Tax=Pseudomonas nitroreducens TaxID=46680 RepID=A0A7W7KM17_PSENT|nr:hypothetical protein [Pseudomonas nitritireducens]MBB4865287.1 hypothetical protein [Pseudomonas nitritireducens]